jgi:LEA14-like dessication related protein
MGQSEPVRVTVIGIETLPGESMEVRMAVKLRVQNPNEAPVDFDGISLWLDVRGATFASGVSAEHGSVPRFGETVVTVPVSISALAAVRQALDLATHQPAAIDYQLRGRLAGAGFGGLRFESRGQVELPRDMGPQLERAQ